jgi:hypothetical protein
VWDFVARFYNLLGLPEPLSLVDVATLVLPCPTSPDHLASEGVRKLGAASCSHLALIGMCATRWITDDVYIAIVNHLGDTPNLKK